MLLVVMGMGRSGTSVLMQVLEAAGFDCGSDWIKTNENNPRGYYERKPIVQFNRDLLKKACPGEESLFPVPTREAIDALIGTPIPFPFPDHEYAIKDPRFSLTYPIWHETFAPHDVRIILSKRNPQAIAESVLRAYGMAPESAFPLIDEYNVRALENAQRFGIPVVDIVYEDWFEAPEKNLSRLEELVGRPLNIDLDTLLDPQLKHCSGDSNLDAMADTALFQKNWLALKESQPTVHQQLQATRDKHSIRIASKNDTSFVFEITTLATGETITKTIPRKPDRSTPPYNRYAGYSTEKYWLLLIGFSALHPEALDTTLSPLSPIIVVEPDGLNILLMLHMDDHSRILSFPSLYVYIGKHAMDRFIKDIGEHLLPFFQTVRELLWIPGPEYMNRLQNLQAPMQAIQQAFQNAITHVHTTVKEALQHWAIHPERSLSRIAIVVPAVVCWTAISRGIAEGFRSSNVETLEEMVSFPPSEITAYASLQLRWHLCKFKPDAILTISHSSSMLIRGMDDIPVRRIVWYVDHPSHLIQQAHHPEDVLVPCWEEFAPVLADRNAPVLDEVPVGAVAIQTSRSPNDENRILFVGTIIDTREICNSLPVPLQDRISEIVEAKISKPQCPITQIIESCCAKECDWSALLPVLQHIMHRPGMNNEQLLHYFFHVEANRLRRLRVLDALHEFPLAIFGSTEWVGVLKGSRIENAFQNASLASPDYYAACASATITLNIHPCFPHSGPTIREFETVLCGGFLLTDMGIYAGDRLQQWFEPDHEIALYQNENDIAERVQHFLDHPDERSAIRERAIACIERDHTYAQRAEMLKQRIEAHPR